MAEERTISNISNAPTFQSIQPQIHPNILNMTLGQILNNNATAQNMIMQSMNLSQGQFQQLLNSAGNNQMLNMTVSDLFKNGTIAQAMQVNPGQVQQMLNPNGQTIPLQTMAVGKLDPATGQIVPLNNTDTQRLEQVPGIAMPQKQTFLQKLRNLFK